MLPASLHPAAPGQPPSRPFVLALFLGAFALRLVLVFLLRDITRGPEGPPSHDDVQFNHLGESLARGDGFVTHEGVPTSFRAPGFPFFLAGLYAVFGVSYPLARVVFCLLGAANAVLAYLLARELLRESHARAVGILSAIYLGNLTVSLSFNSETIFVPLLTLGCWLFVRFLRRGADRPVRAAGGGWWYLAGAGLVLGCATLARPFSLLLLPLWGLLLCWQLRRDLPRLVLAGLVYGVPFLAPILPWTVRNYQTHGHLVLLTTNGGSTFFGGNNARVISERRLWGAWVGTNTLPERPLIDAAPTEYDHDQVEWRLGKEWIRANPGQATLLAALKLVSLWMRPPELDIHGDTVYWLRLPLYYPLLLLIFAGFFRCLRQRTLWKPEWVCLHLTVAATMATAVIFCGLARFRDANVSVLMIYAVLGFDGLVGRLASRGREGAAHSTDASGGPGVSAAG